MIVTSPLALKQMLVCGQHGILAESTPVAVIVSAPTISLGLAQVYRQVRDPGLNQFVLVRVWAEPPSLGREYFWRRKPPGTAVLHVKEKNYNY